MGALPHCQAAAATRRAAEGGSGPVSAIVLKLLARRRRTAIRPRLVWNATAPLPCGLEEHRRVDHFRSSGRHARPAARSEKLYGRSREVETLLAASSGS